MAKKTNELVLFFHKKTTKLVFLVQYGPKKHQSVKNPITPTLISHPWMISTHQTQQRWQLNFRQG